MSAIIRGGKKAPPKPTASASVFQDIEEMNTGGISLSYQEALAAVVEAQNEAEEILVAAQQQARDIRARAEAEAQQMQAQAWEQGFDQGQRQAAQEADEKLRVAVEQHVADLRDDLEAFCQAVLDEQQRVWRDVETQIRDIALEIAARVVKAEVTVHPDVVVQITQHAMRRLADKDTVRIRVNPDDVERLRERREEIMTLFENLRHVEILEDRRVGVGGVQIETDTGTVDARLDTQLAEIDRSLAV